ncbi:unnamed protein product [Closterium sp. NIES-54]
MDVWGPARVRGQGHERYILLVVDDYLSYTSVFPLCGKGDVTEVLIDWIRGARCQLSESLGLDLPVLRLHSDRGGEFSSDLLRAFCRAEGIRQTFTFHASPQQNGIAERCIGMVMDVAHTSMIHAASPHFQWPFAVQYAAHQINLQPRVSLPETTPTLRWTGKVGDASTFRVWGSRAFVRDTSADKLSSRADVTFDESVSYYRLFPYRAASPPPPPLFLAPGTPPVDPLPPQGPAPSGVSQVDPAEPVEVAVDSGAVRGAGPVGARTGGAEPGCVEPGGAEPEGVESGGAVSGGAESGGSSGVLLRREPLSSQGLRKWYARRCCRATGTTGAGAAGGAAGAGATGGAASAGAAGGAPGAGAAEGAACAGAVAGAGAPGGVAGAGAAGGTAGVGAAGGAAGAGVAGGAASASAAGAARPGGARIGGTGAARTGGTAGVGAAGSEAGGVAGVVAGDPGAEVTVAVSAVFGGVARPRRYYVQLLQQILGLPPSPGPTPPLLSPQPVQSQSQLQPSSPLPGPSPYSGLTRGLTERREPKSRPASPESRLASLESCPESPVCAVRTSRRVPRQRPPPVPGTHSMTLRPSTAPQHSDSLRAASPTVTRFLATAVTDPLFESTAASALVTELVDIAAAYRLDYATSLVAESESASVCPPSIGGKCTLGTDVLEDRQEEFECFAATVPHLAAMDAEMASWKSTGTNIDEVPLPGANIVSGMWIFRVNRPPGSPPVFKARYVARGVSQRQGVDFFQTFSPIPKMTTLRVLLHVAAQRDYELHSLDFSTAFLQGSMHEEIWLRRPPGFSGSFPAFTQWSLRRLVYSLRQAPHDLVFATPDTEALAYVKSELQAQRTITLTQSHMEHQVLQRFGFTYSLPQSTPLPTGHSLSAPSLDESVEPSGPYPELVGCLMYFMTCTGPDLAYPRSLLARYVAPGRHREVHWDAAKRVLRYLCSTSGMGLVLGGRARVVLTGHADASWVDDLATQRSSQGYTFSLGCGSVSWWSTRSSYVLSSCYEAEIYAGAMAAQELLWLTYLLTYLGEAPRSPPVLYVDNKAMLALCQEHRLEHKTKHIALRYFLARELQQRGQLRLAYVASQPNTADVFTKALQPCDHQRFCTVLGLVSTVAHLLTS